MYALSSTGGVSVAVLVVETSAWVAFLNGQEDALLEMGLASGQVAVPPLAITELLGQPLPERQRKELERLLALLPVCAADAEHFQRAAKLKAELEARGLSLSARDAHFAQCALDLGAVLVTKDPFFLELQRFSGLKVNL